METKEHLPESENKRCLRAYWLVISPVVLIAVVLVYFLVFSTIASHQWVRQHKEAFSNETNELPEKDFFTDSTYLSLQNQLSFVKARLKMSATDSIGLTVKLTDSTLALEISGVTIHTARINDIDISPSITSLGQMTISKFFSVPLRVKQAFSTIEREPITHVTAPEVNSEELPTTAVPDTSRRDPVFFELILANDFRISVLQNKTDSFKEKKQQMVFLSKRAAVRFWNNFRGAVQGKLPAYTPEIRVKVSIADARILYRALPEKGLVCIKLY